MSPITGRLYARLDDGTVSGKVLYACGLRSDRSVLLFAVLLALGVTEGLSRLQNPQRPTRYLLLPASHTPRRAEQAVLLTYRSDATAQEIGDQPRQVSPAFEQLFARARWISPEAAHDVPAGETSRALETAGRTSGAAAAESASSAKSAATRATPSKRTSRKSLSKKKKSHRTSRQTRRENSDSLFRSVSKLFAEGVNPRRGDKRKRSKK